jgi:hypothetical protein
MTLKLLLHLHDAAVAGRQDFLKDCAPHRSVSHGRSTHDVAGPGLATISFKDRLGSPLGQ